MHPSIGVWVKNAVWSKVSPGPKCKYWTTIGLLEECGSAGSRRGDGKELVRVVSHIKGSWVIVKEKSSIYPLVTHLMQTDTVYPSLNDWYTLSSNGLTSGKDWVTFGSLRIWLPHESP